MHSCDYLIIGGGIAGASLAYQLGPHARVIVVETESVLGYHTTGRSAAMYLDFYGGPKVQPLTLASHDFFQNPPAGFSDLPLWHEEGCLQVARADQQKKLDEAYQYQKEFTPHLQQLDATAIYDRVPFLKADHIVAGIFDPKAKVLDVHQLHQSYVKHARSNGVQIWTDAQLLDLHRDGGQWLAETPKGAIKAEVIINTAGAWADDIAAMACCKTLGLEPKRRTIIIAGYNDFDVPDDMPIVFDVDEEIYFKREASGLLICPADEHDDVAGDVQPHVEDIAYAAHHFAQMTGKEPSTIKQKWAGLRTFAADRNPIIGYDDYMPNFFWSVGQGGFGIQTAPAWSHLAASLVMGQDIPKHIKAEMAARTVSLDDYSPQRFG